MEFLSFWARETLSNIRRNRLMSLLAVSTVAVGLFILGMFYIAVLNLQTVARKQTQKLDIVVVLDRNVTPQRRREIYNAARIPQVADLQIVLKAQVLREQAKRNPDLPIDDLLKNNLNPLGDELRIKLKPEHVDEILKVTAYLESIKGVQKIRRDDEPVKILLAINKFLFVAGAVALLGLGVAIMLIIHNAIRLTVFARRREIQIMELVGATSGFIRVPFLMEGVLYGLVGAVVATLLLAAAYTTVLGSSSGAPVKILPLLMPLGPVEVLWPCALVLVLAGLIFGLLGSWISLNRSIGQAENA